MPELAAAYNAARDAGGSRSYPFSALQWPADLDPGMWDSLTGFLLDMDQDNTEILERWDETVEDSF